MVYQDYMLFPHLTVGENIGFGLRQRKADPASIREEVQETAALLGIERLLSRTPGTLSGGEQQRAAIARALVLRPHVLLLDEPLSALDTSTRDRLRRELRSICRATKTTVIHITHHFEDIFALADRVAVMRERLSRPARRTRSSGNLPASLLPLSPVWRTYTAGFQGF